VKTVSYFSVRKLSEVGVVRHQVESTKNLSVRVNGDAANTSVGHKKELQQFEGMKWKTLIQVHYEP